MATRNCRCAHTFISAVFEVRANHSGDAITGLQHRIAMRAAGMARSVVVVEIIAK